MVSLLALMQVNTVHSAFALLFSLGFSGVGRSPIVYIYLMEMLTPEYQKIAGPLFASSVALCLAFGTFVLQMVTKDSMMLFQCSIALSTFVMLFTYFFIPESPKYLHATG